MSSLLFDTMGTLALDIEAVPADPNADDGGPDFLDSRDFRLLGVGLGVQSRTADGREIEVLFREDIDSEAEVRLLERASEWIQQYPDIETIITYNGAGFDFRHLRGRARILAEETFAPHLPIEVDRWLSSPSHRDLSLEYRRRHGDRRSLEGALNEYGIEVPEPVCWEGSQVTNTRIPELGTEYLCEKSGLADDTPIEPLEETLREYTRRNVDSLFELANEMEIDDRQRVRQEQVLGD